MQLTHVLAVQVKQDRAVCSQQVVVTGWPRSAATPESCTPQELKDEIGKRDETMNSFLKAALGEVEWTLSHQTRPDCCSMVSIAKFGYRKHAADVIAYAKTHELQMIHGRCHCVRKDA
eukprot:2191761-Amphidinium_carterae.2